MYRNLAILKEVFKFLFQLWQKTFLKIIEFATKKLQHYKVLHKNEWLTHNS